MEFKAFSGLRTDTELKNLGVKRLKGPEGNDERFIFQPREQKSDLEHLLFYFHRSKMTLIQWGKKIYFFLPTEPLSLLSPACKNDHY